MNISMIACVGKNLELGKNNDLLWHLPNDLKFFKQVTMGKTVIMGRKTYESLPGKLPKRRNIVLMLPHEENIADVDVFYSVSDVLEEIKKIPEEVFIIGGASIYKQFLPYCEELIISEVKKEYEGNVFFPEYQNDFICYKEDEREEFVIKYYKRK